MLEEKLKIYGEDAEPEEELPQAVLEEYSDDESSSEIDSETGEKLEFIPRRRLTAYKEVFGKELKQQSSNPLRFTKGTDPAQRDLIEFMVDDTIATPNFIPIEESDCIVTASIIQATIINDEIPISEYIKKQHYFNCFKAFTKAVSADPALIKMEILKKLKMFDQHYGILDSQDYKFTVGHYQRFSAIFYL